MSGGADPFAGLPIERRRELCRQIVEELGEIVAGRVPPELAEIVDRLRRDCQPFEVLCRTYRATIELSRECGRQTPGRSSDERDLFDRSVAAVRRRLR